MERTITSHKLVIVSLLVILFTTWIPASGIAFLKGDIDDDRAMDDLPGVINAQQIATGKSTTLLPKDYTATMTTNYIKNQMAKFNAVGLSIALVNSKGIVWEKGFGWADKENQIPATPESVYMLGSGSKFLTAVSLAHLHEKGIIHLDNPISNYLTEFAMIDRYPGQLKKITPRRILNQHSGIPGDLYNAGFVIKEGWDQWGCNLYTNWLMDYLKMDYPSLPPGAMAVYSNIGFVLAGEIALRQDGLSGESFPAYMDRVMFRPLGMDNTSFKTVQKNLTTSYQNGIPTSKKETNCSFGATGGAYTTVQDMAIFITMVLNQGQMSSGKQFLKPATIAMLGETETSPLDIDSYFKPGMGLDSVNDPALSYAGRTWAKNGSTGDYNSFFEILPDLKLGAIVLTNSDTSSSLVYGVIRKCLQNAIFETYGMTPVSQNLPPCDTVDNSSIISGIYVKSHGYDQIKDNGNGTLSWIIDAHDTNPKSYQLILRNTVYRSKQRSESISFKNLTWDGTGHFVMIQSGSSGSISDEYTYMGHVRKIIGEKIVFPAIPNAWKQREGMYVRDNIPWNDVAWEIPLNPFSILAEKNGLLTSDYEITLFPETDTLCFIPGLKNRGDSCLRSVFHEGKDKLLIGGYRLYPMGQIPVVTAGDTINGTVTIFESDWFRFDTVSPGTSVTVKVNNGADYVLTVFDSSLSLLTRKKEIATWVSQQGSYYFVISPTPDADNNYTLTITNQ
ncbi:serine hydrolase domain-containing protein [Desulfobacula sp.]